MIPEKILEEMANRLDGISKSVSKSIQDLPQALESWMVRYTKIYSRLLSRMRFHWRFGALFAIKSISDPGFGRRWRSKLESILECCDLLTYPPDVFSSKLGYLRARLGSIRNISCSECGSKIDLKIDEDHILDLITGGTIEIRCGNGMCIHRYFPLNLGMGELIGF